MKDKMKKEEAHNATKEKSSEEVKSTLTADLIAEASGALNLFDEEGANEDSLETLQAGAAEDLGDFLEEDLVADGDEEEMDEAEAIDEVEHSLSEGTELDAYESAEIEEEELLEDDQVSSIIESILFSTDKPQSLSAIKQAFKGTNISSKQIRRAMELLTTEYAGARRGITLEEVTGGYQLRTKVDNMPYLKRMLKVRTFKLSGPALEVLSIVAYKQPCIKSDVDDIRGVESGHLMRGLLDRGLMAFAGKSELPGKPMYYQTTRKFLEIFGLRSVKELPSLSEIDELIPEGIDHEEEKKTLDMLTEDLSEEVGTSYSEGEEELSKITDKLSAINTSSDFFEQEKQRERDKRDAQRAQDIREALVLEDEVPEKDRKWLERYDAKLQEAEAAQKAQEEASLAESAAAEEVQVAAEAEDALGVMDSLRSVDSSEEDDVADILAEAEEGDGFSEADGIVGEDYDDFEEESESSSGPRFDEASDSWAHPIETLSENGLDHELEFDPDLIEASGSEDPEKSPV
ncbi:MAG: SMC-Scp complex subunit ScpB [Bdellovibrionales bacterium]|nr:SMC-Scp complex subunit ScpB [Bdellovibrionales bacterium]